MQKHEKWMLSHLMSCPSQVQNFSKARKSDSFAESLWILLTCVEISLGVTEKKTPGRKQGLGLHEMEQATRCPPLNHHSLRCNGGFKKKDAIACLFLLHIYMAA